MKAGIIGVMLLIAMIGLIVGDMILDRRMNDIEARVDAMEERADRERYQIWVVPEPGVDAQVDSARIALWGPDAAAVPPSPEGGE